MDYNNFLLEESQANIKANIFCADLNNIKKNDKLDNTIDLSKIHIVMINDGKITTNK